MAVDARRVRNRMSDLYGGKGWVELVTEENMDQGKPTILTSRAKSQEIAGWCTSCEWRRERQSTLIER